MFHSSRKTEASRRDRIAVYTYTSFDRKMKMNYACNLKSRVEKVFYTRATYRRCCLHLPYNMPLKKIPSCPCAFTGVRFEIQKLKNENGIRFYFFAQIIIVTHSSSETSRISNLASSFPRGTHPGFERICFSVFRPRVHIAIHV